MPGFRLVEIVEFLPEVVQIGHRPVAFGAVGEARQRRQVEAFEALARPRPVCEQALGRGARLLHDERAVHHEQRLRGYGGRTALAAGVGGVAEVEQRKQVGQVGPAQGQVNRAAGELVGVLADAVGAGFAVGADTRVERAAHRRIEVAADGQQGVANLFDGQAAAREARQQAVFGVGPDALGVERSRRPVGARKHDQAVQALERPAVFAQAARQVVEQLGVRRLFSELAEIVGGAHQRLAEVPAPNAVGDDARGKRIAFADDPAGQVEAAARRGKRGGRFPARQDRRPGLRHGGAEVMVVAANEDALRDGLALDDGAGHRNLRGGRGGFQLLLLRQKLGQPGALPGVERRHLLLGGAVQRPAVEPDLVEEEVVRRADFGFRADQLAGTGVTPARVAPPALIAVVEVRGLLELDGVMFGNGRAVCAGLAPLGQFGGRRVVEIVDPLGQHGRLKAALGRRCRGVRPMRIDFEGADHVLGHVGVVFVAAFLRGLVEVEDFRNLRIDVEDCVPGLGESRVVRGRGQRGFDGTPFRSVFVAVRRGENRGQRIVVALQDRVELVVVAAGARHRKPEKRLGSDVDLIVDDVVALQDEVALRQGFFAQREKTRGDDAVGTCSGGGVGGQDVARQLLPYEAVVRHVVVERADHVVPVAPGVRVAVVLIAAGGVGIARHVEPVAAPALAVAGRAQQALDDVGEGVFRVVGQEGADFLFRRRQSGQVEGRAPQQSLLVGVRRGREAVRFEFGEDEAVHGRTHPALGLDRGRRLPGKRAKRPEIAVRVGNLSGGVVRANGLGLLHAGPGGALRQPAADDVDFSRVQAALRRHLDALLVA